MVLNRMIRALIYSDLQATEGHERCFTDPALPLQRYRVELLYKKLFELYTAYNCNALWDAGDTTDDRTAIPMPVLRAISLGLQPFKGGAHNVKITGNHEQYTRNTEIDNRSIFEPFFTVYSGVQAVELEGVVLIACSFPASNTEAAEQIQSLLLKHRRKPCIILGHLEVCGTKMKSGTSLAGIPTSVFDNASLTLLGHVHLPQQLGDSIFYIGSPFQQNYGEAGEDKRLGLLTIDGDEVTLEWIPLTGFPQYRRVSLAQFESQFDPQSEDRYTVTIASPDEAAKFYAHPYSCRATANYAYDVLNPELPGESEAAPQDWTLHAAAKRWVDRRDPATFNIAATPADLLDFGVQIAEMR